MQDRENYWQTLSGRRLDRRRALNVAALTAGAGVATLAGLACGGGKSSSTSGASGTKAGAAGTPNVGARNRLATPSSAQVKSGGRISYPTPSEPPDLDPRLTLSYGLHNFVSAIHNRVVRTVHG